MNLFRHYFITHNGSTREQMLTIFILRHQEPCRKVVAGFEKCILRAAVDTTLQFDGWKPLVAQESLATHELFGRLLLVVMMRWRI